ncbi:hypothetical protein [Streptomyces sedi]|uniref:Sortase n=1 Tax=Streptomyces sedi TaxID=555059 RepID=A0A5C4VFJ5_9ACTN|nr:hypothetical protein [Streptomyces sedi]TNM34542.1 hypothetical protein FH715_02445 [Streptomyces sedi]
MGITRSLTLTLCAAATVTAAVGAAPARAADGRSGEGDAVLVTPARPLPGEGVGLLVPECAGAESGEAVSLAFSGTVRLTPGQPGGGLVGEARIDAETVPGHHPIQVTCGQPDGALYGLVTVGGGAPAADHAGGGGDPTAEGPEPLGAPASEPTPERGGRAEDGERGEQGERGEHGERCGPGHEKPERPEKPEHTDRPGHTERPEHTEHSERPDDRRDGEGRGTGHGTGHGTDERCRHDGGREHGASPSAPVRAGGGGTAASLSSTPAQPAVSWGDALPASLALLAGGGATWAVRRLRSRSGSRAGR